MLEGVGQEATRVRDRHRRQASESLRRHGADCIGDGSPPVVTDQVRLLGSKLIQACDNVFGDSAKRVGVVA